MSQPAPPSRRAYEESRREEWRQARPGSYGREDDPHVVTRPEPSRNTGADREDRPEPNHPTRPDHDTIIANWAALGLARPPEGQVWVRSGRNAVLIDRGTQQIIAVVPGPLDNGPGEPDGLYAQPLYNVGIAWNAQGGWATRVAPTLHDAIAQAIQACSALSGPCADSGISISADTPLCFAVARSGTRLYGADEADLNAAVETANQRCQDDGNEDCVMQVANCNDNP